jgi:DNA repair protein RecN (Recombination protein N)
MLKHLSISNLAILENIEIDFKNGFSVIMGATGAGKSLIIDSLSLLLGSRASSELIRQGESKATIRGDWEVASPKLSALLSSFNVPFDGELCIERVIGKSKSGIKANGVNISLGDLSSIAPLLANIHSQFDAMKLLNLENYLSLIDSYRSEMLAPYLENYRLALASYRKKQARYEELSEKKKKLESERDFYEYQYNELKGMRLEEGEQERIANEISLLRNYDSIYSLVQESSTIVHGEAIEKLYDLNKNVAKLVSFQSQYSVESKRLDEAYYELEDIFSNLKSLFAGLDYDPARLNELESRDSELSSLERKYRKSIPELISYLKELEGLLGKGSTFDEDLETAKKEAGLAFDEAFAKANDLSTVRKQVAKLIEKSMKKNLSDLLLRDVFSISFAPLSKDPSCLKENGMDEVAFLLETNVGEGLKPMEKIISGGESSRLMLAFHAIYLASNKVGTAIFDEIDTGISGEASRAVASKIYEISLSSQVIAITHAPQVACLSDHAIMISKQVKQGRTSTSIKELSLEQKIDAVAGLISNGKITDKQREYAKEMVLEKGR